MSKTAHRIFLFTLVFIVAVVFSYLLYNGFSFYKTPVVDRPFDRATYNLLKPSGLYGHGFGIIGSAFILIGVLIYMLRKRFRIFFRLGQLKYWLEFHIFLCTLGPILVLYHTSFKFGGIVAISFWSMVAVFASGIIGRFIYIQIPRSIEGRELSLGEVKNMKTDVQAKLNTNSKLDEASREEITNLTKRKIGVVHSNFISGYFKTRADNKQALKRAREIIKQNGLNRSESKNIIHLLKNEISLNRKIDRLLGMQRLLKYWHVAHLPFAFIMLIVMIIHVVIAIMFGAKWIF
jgi:hypothetical protein